MTQVRATLGVHLQPELERFVGMACQACFREGYARGLALGEHYRQQAVALKAELANAQPSRIGHDHP